MPSNTRALVDRFVEAAQQQREHPLDAAVAFEMFAAQSVLRSRNLSDDEISAGRIGGGGDGGLDSVHVFLDETLLDEDSPIFEPGFQEDKIRRGARLEIVLSQAKREISYTETAVDKVASSLGRLLDLEQSDEDLSQLYSVELIARFRLFTRA